jgi:hypothetical protein
MTKSLYYNYNLFLHQNQEYFFQQHWESLEKNHNTPSFKLNDRSLNIKSTQINFKLLLLARKHMQKNLFLILSLLRERPFNLNGLWFFSKKICWFPMLLKKIFLILVANNVCYLCLYIWIPVYRCMGFSLETVFSFPSSRHYDIAEIQVRILF